MTSKRTFVIVGANLAGGRAAETLRAEGFDGRIFLVGEEPDRPYERPPLSKELLRGEAEPAFLRPEAWYEEHGVELVLGRRVTALDPRGRVTLDGSENIAFDACLLATGGRPRTLPRYSGAHVLRTLRDAFSLRERLKNRPRLVVVGAGFIGSEVAASARTMGCEVTVLEILPLPLQRVLGPDLGRVYADLHREHGVDLRLGEAAQDFTPLPEDVVLVGIGIVPNVELALEAGIECDDGILVDEACRTSAPKVFAAGDVARPRGGFRVEHFHNAQVQGVAAARGMLGRPDPVREVPWFWSDTYDTNLQMLGHFGRRSERIVRGSLEQRNFIAFELEEGRIVAAVAMNRGRDVAVVRRLIQRGVAVDPARLADDEVPLQSYL